MFDDIIEREDFDTNFTRYRKYSEAVIRRFIDDPKFNITKWQGEIWENIVHKDRDRVIQEVRRWEASGSRDKDRDRNNRERNGRQGSRSRPDDDGLQHQQRPQRRERADKTDTSGRCIFCGKREDHNSFYCPQNTGACSASVGRTTSAPAAPTPSANLRTPAPFAAPVPRLEPCTAPRAALSAPSENELFPIVTPLIADQWEHWITKVGLAEEYADVPKGIRNGFAHGLNPSLKATTTFIPRNLQSALDHSDIIDAYIAKEQNLNRISPAYDPILLEGIIGPFRCSPVGCVQKDPPHGKWRMYNHHSYPRNDPDVPSINSQIDKEDFIPILPTPPMASAATHRIARSLAAEAFKRNSRRPTVASGGITKNRLVRDCNNRPEAKAKLECLLEYAWADSTLEKYGNSLAAYHAYCDEEGISASQRLPANEFLLCTYASSRAGEVSAGTVRGSLAAVKAWHIINNAEWHGGIRLRYTLRAVENVAPESSKRPVRPPVTAAMVDILGEELDHNDPLDSASSNADASPTVADLKPPSTSAGSRELHLPWTKTKGKHGDDAMLCKQRIPSDPINAVNHHLQVNRIPANLPLFSYRNTNGHLICLTRKKFLQRCNEIWSRHGFPAYSGHSFRIGGTTELLLAGVHPDVVKVMGRWQSDAFKVYWRRVDILATLHWEFKAV
ncbi:putative reverse transcriptase domain protein [Mycena venus]|uniref:Putative reverse transcriptase domain protein n=1 Tax=Mycena venus TaxID=2733690 RepID=A0A8H6YSE0_9AGAR|nr:putative reverse transcriptase domain protein [Mycena venus]